MKYRLEVTEEQLRVMENCCNLYMRVLMGQTTDLCEILTEHLMKKYKEDSPDKDVIFEKYITKRNAISEILKSVMRIVYANGYGVPDYKTEDGMIAECLWDSIRFARGRSRWDSPFQIGSEPCPKIEKVEDEGDSDE